jgi:hypothetical protein
MRRFCKPAGLQVTYTSRLAAEVICEPGLLHGINHAVRSHLTVRCYVLDESSYLGLGIMRLPGGCVLSRPLRAACIPLSIVLFLLEYPHHSLSITITRLPNPICQSPTPPVLAPRHLPLRPPLLVLRRAPSRSQSLPLSSAQSPQGPFLSSMYFSPNSNQRGETSRRSRRDQLLLASNEHIEPKNNPQRNTQCPSSPR